MIPRAQEEMLHNVLDFAGREARDVMTRLPTSSGSRPTFDLKQGLQRVVE